jgi:hypothetical protein
LRLCFPRPADPAGKNGAGGGRLHNQLWWSANVNVPAPRQRSSSRTRHRSALAHIRRALPSPGVALGGAVLWGLAMGTSALFNLLLANWETPTKVRVVLLLFAAGGTLAFPTGIFASGLFSQGRSTEVASAAAFVSLLVATIGFTGGIYAIGYHPYYFELQPSAPVIAWTVQFAYETASALYQFTVLGIRLYFPIGFVALILVRLWFATRR